MRNGRLVFLIVTKDSDLAVDLVRLLAKVDVDAFWVTAEEGRKLSQAWEVDAWLHDRSTCLN